MKIAFIIQFNQSEIGGLFYAATERIKYFIEENKDFDVYVFNIRAKPHLFIRLIRYIIKREKFYPSTSIYNNLKVRNIYYSIKITESIKRLMRDYKFDLNSKIREINQYFKKVDLIAAHFGNGPGEIALLLSEYLRKEYTVTFHGSDINITPFLNEEKQTLYTEILKKSSANIFVSKNLMKKSFRIYDTSEKCYALHNGIDFDHFKRYKEEEINRLKEKMGFNTKVVGFIGNLIEVKNVFSLVEIFNLIKKNWGNVTFIIIGDGVLKYQLKEDFLIKGIDVNFLGYIQREKMPIYYNLIDVMILPSINEGLPLTILEALACGVNCVGSRVGGIPEILSDENTFKLGKNFELSIAHRIISLLSKDKKPSIDISKYDLKSIAKREGEIYRKIINKKS